MSLSPSHEHTPCLPPFLPLSPPLSPFPIRFVCRQPSPLPAGDRGLLAPPAGSARHAAGKEKTGALTARTSRVLLLHQLISGFCPPRFLAGGWGWGRGPGARGGGDEDEGGGRAWAMRRGLAGLPHSRSLLRLAGMAGTPHAHRSQRRREARVQGHPRRAGPPAELSGLGRCPRPACHPGRGSRGRNGPRRPYRSLRRRGLLGCHPRTGGAPGSALQHPVTRSRRAEWQPPGRRCSSSTAGTTSASAMLRGCPPSRTPDQRRAHRMPRCLRPGPRCTTRGLLRHSTRACRAGP